MSVAAVEILQSRPLLLAGVQPKGGHKYLQGDCGTLGLGMASLYEAKGSRLSCREDSVTNGVMPKDAVAVPSAAHLVVPEGICRFLADRAAVRLLIHSQPRPVLQA